MVTEKSHSDKPLVPRSESAKEKKIALCNWSQEAIKPVPRKPVEICTRSEVSSVDRGPLERVCNHDKKHCG